ncbi:DUF4190 domain-containing protein [Akkermansiaceae bacterium]|nr:DUF4190 domain-containing protein [Akkermansiaceae bacterium]
MNNDPYTAPIENSQAQAAALPHQTSGLAIASLICGICSFVLCLFAFTGIPAIICGHMAKSRIKKSGNTITGSGMATAGLIMGYLSIFIMVLAALAAPSIVKQTGLVEITKDTISLKPIHSAILAYEEEFKTYPDDLSQLEDIKIKDDAKWIYFPGQSSSSDSNNILIASEGYKNNLVIALRIDGTIEPLSATDYEADIASQKTP